MGRKKSVFGRLKDRLTGNGNGDSNLTEAEKAAKAEAEAEKQRNKKLSSHKLAEMGIIITDEDLDGDEMDEEKMMKTELLHELSAAFDIYTKGLTSIPCKEIGYILRSLGQNPTEDDIINWINEAGCSWDGYLTRDDFIEVGIVAMQKQANRLDDVRAAFRAFDHDNNGSISKEELRDAMTRYGHTFTVEECDEMFTEADANNDGKIDFDEFVAMMSVGDSGSFNYAST